MRRRIRAGPATMGRECAPCSRPASDSRPRSWPRRPASCGSLRVDRIHAGHRRLPGVPVDVQQRTPEGSESFRRRHCRDLERARPERHPHPAVQLQRQSHLVGALRVLGGRLAAQRAVRRPPVERIGVVPHRPRVRASDAVALEAPGRLGREVLHGLTAASSFALPQTLSTVPACAAGAHQVRGTSHMHRSGAVTAQPFESKRDVGRVSDSTNHNHSACAFARSPP